MRRTWMKWALAVGLVAFLAIAVLLALIAVLALLPADAAVDLGRFAEAHFWWLTGIRWFLYALVMLSWPRIARWGAMGSDGIRWETYQKLRAGRWPVLRVLIVYELLFPFNLIGKLGALL